MISIAVAALLGLGGLGAAQAGTAGPESLSVSQAQVLSRFAPILLQEADADPARRRWDFPIPADFDGDLRADNNEQSLRSGRHPLEASLYGALVETASHYFLTYSVFHALDWSPMPAFIPYSWHENDMENLQIVVRKRATLEQGQVEIAAVQAHLGTRFAAAESAGVSGDRLAGNPILLLDLELRKGGSHAVVLSERGGHGLSFADSGFVPERYLVFRPSGSDAADTCRPDQSVFSYRILSLHDRFWLPYRNGTDIGNGKLLDGRFDYGGERAAWQGLPRHFDADRWSGPFKRDAGILPFAFSTGLMARDLGVLFFDPALKYPALFAIKGEWDRNYLYNPYWPAVPATPAMHQGENR